MPDSVLWPLDSHTAAKHRVLRAYLDGWLPVLGRQAQQARSYGDDNPRLLMVDGFAGPGRYKTGEPGSPLIMLDALLSHRGFGDLNDVQFIFFFIEQKEDRVEHLRGEIAGLGELPDNVSVAIERADRCTLVDTPFRKAHLRRLTLQPAERAGELEVRRPGRGFKNAKLRFRS